VAFPAPVPGLVIRYSYLWYGEYERGQEEGVKDRPCAIVLVADEEQGRQIVTVVPVTHTPPAADSAAIEIPVDTKRRLGLDADRSWIVVDEANSFAWPGPDVRPLVAGEPETVVYGPLPRKLFNDVRDRFLRLAATGAVVPRTE
jgi:PemK-like, MazF-like toxin of type II toxin-antitoxin system